MQLIFSDEQLPLSVKQTIFLEGPSPRRPEVDDWRTEAVALLKEKGFQGHVIIPRFREDFFKTGSSTAFDYDTQINFEKQGRERADVILIWLARDIKGEMPGFTTNFEMGEDYQRGNVVYGHPETANKVSYMDLCAEAINLPIYSDLSQAIDACLQMVGEGATREGGEVTVPFYIWNHPEFKTWYQNLRGAGNRLYDLKVERAVMVKDRLFSFQIKPKIWVAEEDRFKENESVYFRPTIHTVIPYYKQGGDTWVALVREFRSTVNNTKGFVWEFPGGSSFTEKSSVEVATQELKEELGLVVEASQLVPLGTMQQAATVTATLTQGYTLELTEEEWNSLPNSTEVLGVLEEGEMTRVFKVKLSELANLPVDLATLGLLYKAGL